MDRTSPRHADALAYIRKGLASLTLAVLVLSAAWSLKVMRSDQDRMPDPEVVHQANAMILAEAEAGDAVRVLPVWFNTGREGLLELDTLMTADLDPYDLHRYERLWLAYDPGSASQAAEERRQLRDVVTVFEGPHWTVERGIIDHERPVIWDGYTAVQEADVAQWRPQQASLVECDRWSHESWNCGPRNRWVFVGPRYQDVDDNPRTCVVANPPPDQASWIIRWDDLPREGRLRLRAANTLLAVRGLRGGDVTLTAYLDGVEVAAHTFAPHDFGFVSFDVPIPSNPPASFDTAPGDPVVDDAPPHADGSGTPAPTDDTGQDQGAPDLGGDEALVDPPEAAALADGDEADEPADASERDDAPVEGSGEQAPTAPIVDTPPPTAPAPAIGDAEHATLEIRISATDHMDRFFCFTPQVYVEPNRANLRDN